MVRELNYGAFLLGVQDGSNTLEIANEIQENEEVSWATPDFIAERSTTNDPLFVDQYYLKNTGQFGGTAGIDIKAEQAWAITTGCNVRVAVLDLGLETHEEFTGRVLPGYTPGSSGGGAPASAGDNHGVMCAGIIGASHNNSIGIKGIAPNVLLIPVKVIGSGLSDSDVATAITWAYSSTGGNADILSNSWSYSNRSFSNSSISTAISNARTLGRNNRGSVVIFSSGNENNNWSGVTFPSKLPGVITVGAINNQGNIWSYSSRGPEMDLVAPTGNVNSLGDVRTTDRMGTNGGTPGKIILTHLEEHQLPHPRWQA